MKIPSIYQKVVFVKDTISIEVIGSVMAYPTLFDYSFIKKNGKYTSTILTTDSEIEYDRVNSLWKIK